MSRVITAMVTPFDENLQVDYQRAQELARRLVDLGSDGLLVSGSTGEAVTLTVEEKLRLMAAVVAAVGARVPVWGGTGSNDTAASIALTKEAEKVGVDGVLLVVPAYNKPPQEGMYQHFKAVAEATSLPVMLYNVPGRTASNLLPETVKRLAEIDNIVALKEASGDLDQVSEIIRSVPEDFYVLSGDDSLTLPILAVGGHGVVSVSGHLIADRMMAMIQAFTAGDVRTAAAIHAEVFPINRAIFCTTNPIPIKTSLRYVGFPCGGFRPPLVEATETQMAVLKEAMRAQGLI
ncbi:MAG TPA: 4-hydroxy-tetrahydrodipicolinate synthase [Firmicutes bacterium]|nr:4-hydroxy-tetrahydrodipicolinate synthase [Bacillota bacterium]